MSRTTGADGGATGGVRVARLDLDPAETGSSATLADLGSLSGSGSPPEDADAGPHDTPAPGSSAADAVSDAVGGAVGAPAPIADLAAGSDAVDAAPVAGLDRVDPGEPPAPASALDVDPRGADRAAAPTADLDRPARRGSGRDRAATVTGARRERSDDVRPPRRRRHDAAPGENPSRLGESPSRSGESPPRGERRSGPAAGAAPAEPIVVPGPDASLDDLRAAVQGIERGSSAHPGSGDRPRIVTPRSERPARTRRRAESRRGADDCSADDRSADDRGADGRSADEPDEDQPGFGHTGEDGDGHRARGTRRPGPKPIDPDGDAVAQAKEICLRLLTDRARTRKELTDALRQREVPDDAIGAVLDRFDEVGLIDDAAFAGQWVRSRHRVRGLARRAIAQELRRKGVDGETAEEALAEVDGDAEEQRARELVERKARTVPIGTPEERQKATRRLVGMLARKGYGAGTAYRVVKDVLAERGAEADEDDAGPFD